MMKKIILVFAVTALHLSAMSQVEKPVRSGNIIYGGSLSAEYSITKSLYYPNSLNGHVYNYFLLDLGPGLLYFIADHVAVGGVVSAQAYMDPDILFRLGLGPAFSYYADNGLVFGIHSEAFLGFFTELYETYIELNPFIGYAWFINSKTAIEPRINYNHTTLNYTGDLEGMYIKKNKLFFNVTFSKFL